MNLMILTKLLELLQNSKNDWKCENNISGCRFVQSMTDEQFPQWY
jgi:hypothetical protein